MIHSEMIQEWHTFLEKVFERRIYEIFSGGRAQRIKIDLQLTLPDDIENNLAEAVQRRAVQSFSVASYEKRLRMVIQLLGKPVKSGDERLLTIRKHKVIRDVIQHNKGELRERDLKELGVHEITMMGNAPFQQVTYKVGDIVTITHLEVDQLAKGLIETARSLIQAAR